MTTTRFIRFLFAQACALFCIAFAGPAHAADVSGVKFDDSIRLGGDELRLNGAAALDGVGIYRRANKTIVMGLYVKERRSSAAELVALPGAKRMTVAMIDDVDSERMSRGFVRGIQNNVERADRVKIASQLLKFGETFAAVGVFKKGEVFHVDWLPGQQLTVITMNGKKLLEVPDQAFYNAFLLCFIGDRPIGPEMKKAMLGG
jgi:hypothetical protein